MLAPREIAVPRSPLSDNASGALWIIASCLAATFMSVAVRVASADLPVVQVVFMRSALGALFVLGLLTAKRGYDRAQGKAVEHLRFSRPWLHLLRGVLFLGAINCGFYALSTLPLATATTLFFFAPVFATAFAAIFTGEKVGPRRWGAVAAAFAGGLVILRPGFAQLEMGTLAALGSAFLFSVSLLVSRPLARADGASSVLVSSTVTAGLLMAIPAWIVWRPLGLEMVGVLVVLTVMSTARMYADIRAYAVADAGFLAPFAFVRLLFIAIAGWVAFREGMDTPTLIGAGIIIGATVFIAQREAKLQRA